MEIPTPEVRHLLKFAPTIKTDISEELTTPTGAIIIRTNSEKIHQHDSGNPEKRL